MKKWLLLIMVLALALLTACGSQRAGEDTSHPYSWKEKRDGSILLTIEGTVEDGYDWQVDGADGSILQVEKLEKSSAKKAYFSVTPLDRGNAALTFTCERESLLEDQVFQISLRLQTDEDGKLTVTGNSEQELQGVSSAGEETDSPYIWQTDSGSLNLFITPKGSSGNWRAVGVDNTYLSVSGPVYDQNGCAFQFTGKAAGETGVVLWDAEENFGITLTLTVDESGAITVTDHQEGPYEAAETDVPGMTQFKALVGDVTLPEGARLDQCQTFAWDGKSEADIGEVRFLLNGNQWSCIVSKTVPLETLAEPYTALIEEPYETTVGAYPVTVCVNANEGAAFWQDDLGRSIGLFGISDSMTQETMTAAVKECMGGGNG